MTLLVINHRYGTFIVINTMSVFILYLYINKVCSQNRSDSIACVFFKTTLLSSLNKIYMYKLHRISKDETETCYLDFFPVCSTNPPFGTKAW